MITGGSSGIGLATAQEFVSEGAYVFITGRRERELAVAVKEIGSNISDIRADVSNSGDLDRLFSQIKNDKGKLDILAFLIWAHDHCRLSRFWIYFGQLRQGLQGAPVLYTSKRSNCNRSMLFPFFPDLIRSL